MDQTSKRPRRPNQPAAIPEHSTLRRGPGTHRTGSAASGSAAPPNARGNGPGPSAPNLVAELFKEFIPNRRKGRTAAYAGLQAKLAEHAQELVPMVVTLPDLVDMHIKIENFMKQEEGIRTEDPMSTLREYLLGNDITGKLPGKVQ